MNYLPIPRQVTVANMHQHLTLTLNHARDPMQFNEHTQISPTI